MVALDFLTAAIISIFYISLGKLPLVPLMIVVLMLLYGHFRSIPALCTGKHPSDGWIRSPGKRKCHNQYGQHPVKSFGACYRRCVVRLLWSYANFVLKYYLLYYLSRDGNIYTYPAPKKKSRNESFRDRPKRFERELPFREKRKTDISISCRYFGAF